MRKKVHWNIEVLAERYLMCRSTRRLGKIYEKGADTIRSRLHEYQIPLLPSGGASLAPGKWARLYDRCVEHGGTDRPHYALGLCDRCYWRIKWADRYARDRELPREANDEG